MIEKFHIKNMLQYVTKKLQGKEDMPQHKDDMWHIFVDNSGSTYNCTLYWNKVRVVVKELSQNSKVYCWNSKLIINQKEVKYILEHGDANGGTSIDPVARYCVKNNINGNIIIITDGDVLENSVEAATTILRNHIFKKVKIYICGNNLSVGAAFSRNCEVELIHLLSEKLFYSISNEDLELLKNIKDISYSTFNEKFDTLMQLVATQVRGYDKNEPKVLNMRHKLIIMGKKITKEKRLLDTKAAKKVNVNTVLSVQKSELNEDQKIAQCEEIIDSLLYKYNQNDGDDLQQKLNALYNLTSGCLKSDFSVNGINSYKAGHALDSTLTSKTNLVEEDSKIDGSKVVFECPVSLDEGRFCLLLKKGRPILEDIPKDVVKNIIENPLMLLLPSFREYLVKFFKRFDKGLSLDVVANNLFDHISPETRAKVEDYFMIFGQSKEFVNATNASLLHLVAGGKRLGNPNVWYTLFWYAIKYKVIKETEYLEEYLDQIEDTLKYRLYETKMTASMTGLPGHFNIMMPYAEAVYFIYGCGHIQNKYMPNLEAFRVHLPYLFVFEKLIDFLGWNVSKEAKNHMRLIAAMMSLLKSCKTDSYDSYYSYESIIKALTCNSQQINEEKIGEDMKKNSTIIPYIPLDFKASEESANKARKLLNDRIPACKNLSIEEIQSLFDVIDISKKSNVISLPESYKKTYEPARNWKNPDLIAKDIAINMNTCRPHMYSVSVTADIMIPWKVSLFEQTKNKPSETMSTTKEFMEFICKYKRVPTLDEFLVHLYNRIVLNQRKKSTLCKNTVIYYENTLKYYTPALNKLSIPEIISRYNKSLHRDDREKMEK